MLIFWITKTVSLLCVLYLHAEANVRKVQADWSKYRCNPAYMLLAGTVDPETGVAGNFQHCLNMIGKNVVGNMTDALGSQFSIIGDAVSGLANPLSLMRQMTSNIRLFIASFAASTLGKVSGPMSMFVYYLNKIQDLFRRMVGEGYIATFLGVTFASFVEGFVKLIMSILRGFIIAMLIISTILFLVDFPLWGFIVALAVAMRTAGAPI
jgi:hypothetical protein